MTAHDSVSEFCPPPPMSGLLDVEVVRDEAGEAVVFVRVSSTGPRCRCWSGACESFCTPALLIGRWW
jgi:hypothetical protein